MIQNGDTGVKDSTPPSTPTKTQRILPASSSVSPIEKEITPPISSNPTPGGQTGSPLKRTFTDTVRGGPPQWPGSHFLNPDSPKVGTLNHSDGVRIAVFTQADVAKLSAPFQHTLIVQFLNQRHVLIFLDSANEYAKLWLKQEIFINNFPMRLFKWMPSFNVKQEPSIALVRVRFSGLPLHFFDKHALFTIGKLIGEPLKIDEAMTTLSRINFARLCIEIDLKQKPPDDVFIMNAGELLRILVVYEKLPQYCSHCHHLGHEESSCYIKNAGPRPHRNLERSFPPRSKPKKGKEKSEEDSPAGSDAKTVESDSGQSAPALRTEVDDPPLLRAIVSLPSSPPMLEPDPADEVFKPLRANKKSRMQKEVEALLKSQLGKKTLVSRTRKI
ncbi:hypothetical protein CDL12_00255 [Handroanthus impetiginosus]|uniref:Uncharacterized protein n=1 Tax=Handroanthus impetiginosus TaxID=429701 RepID=A0A2G9IB40_9LAMI|nr:hypothetical protein CDL12_00255 [Handroanthus impetiginosus]